MTPASLSRLAGKPLIPVASRYIALGLQLLMFALITRSLKQNDAGSYFVFFGIVTVSSCAFGLGIPDGLVRFVPALRAQGTANVRGVLTRSFVISLLTSAPMIAVLALYAERLGGGPFIAFCIVCWWLSYGIVYFSSQGLVAVRREELGSFFFYSSINLATFAALAMYLLVAPRPELAGAIATATFAALVAASISLYALARLAPAGRSGLRVPLKEASQVGASIVAARVLQGLLFWIPVWTVAHAFSPARAAVFAIASRLLFGVMGALAAVRFSVRPAIVAAIALDRWPDIERDGRRIAIVACAAVILAILATLAVGEPILGAFFGEQYRPAAMILVVLLLGGLGESIGGPVDEVIKMSGGQSIALVAIGVVVAVEFCLALIGARGGLLWVAAAQAAAFWLLYGFYVFYLQSRCGVLLLPVIRRQVSSAATQRSKAEIRT